MLFFFVYFYMLETYQTAKMKATNEDAYLRRPKRTIESEIQKNFIIKCIMILGTAIEKVQSRVKYKEVGGIRRDRILIIQTCTKPLMHEKSPNLVVNAAFAVLQ